LLRLLYQGWLDQRASGEAAAPVVGAEGVCRPHARLLDRGLKTVFGRVTVTRTGYSAHDAENLFPRDAELNLPPDLYSYGVRRRTVDEVIKTSFDQAAAALSKTTGTTVPKRQLEGLADRAAVDLSPSTRRAALRRPATVTRPPGSSSSPPTPRGSGRACRT
jgi:hypothetical protein